GEQSASYGNGCWLSPSSVLPMSAPGLGKKVPGFLADPLRPLAMRWRYLPQAWPWLWRFLATGSTPAKLRVIATALRPLVEGCPALHKRLAEEAGVGHLIHMTGLLYAFPSRAEFEAEKLGWTIRAEQGVRWDELDGDELRQMEPALDRRYQFGAFVQDGGHCSDPGAYVAALVAHAQAQGAELVAARATGFAMVGGRLRAVTSSAGDIACDRAVIAAGAHSKALAAMVGDKVPLETERGYHAEISNPESAPRIPIMPSDSKAATTTTAHGLRIAGQVEIAGLEAAPNWRRAEILRDFVRRVIPGLPADLPAERIKLWMGHRPSTPDGLPCIGPASGCADVVHAFGHGHVGLAAGAISGRLVADLVGGTKPVIDPAPYAAARFR
ncbi:MAG: FAD-dependent oxidoreductase, partial [Acetobacteraceae bacterium]|nr:FAD-dependent oxidoreductase [Acetobacteraceae bacterium]